MDKAVLAQVVVSDMCGGWRPVTRHSCILYEVVEVLAMQEDLPKVGTRSTFPELAQQYDGLRNAAIVLGKIGIHYDTKKPVLLK